VRCWITSTERVSGGVIEIGVALRRAAHFIDPALNAILESSLTPDDNDLFLSNLAHIPILAIHGYAKSFPWFLLPLTDKLQRER
jgi:hypothetical protein